MQKNTLIQSRLKDTLRSIENLCEFGDRIVLNKSNGNYSKRFYKKAVYDDTIYIWQNKNDKNSSIAISFNYRKDDNKILDIEKQSIVVSFIQRSNFDTEKYVYLSKPFEYQKARIMLKILADMLRKEAFYQNEVSFETTIEMFDNIFSIFPRTEKMDFDEIKNNADQMIDNLLKESNYINIKNLEIEVKKEYKKELENSDEKKLVKELEKQLSDAKSKFFLKNNELKQKYKLDAIENEKHKEQRKLRNEIKILLENFRKTQYKFPKLKSFFEAKKECLYKIFN